MVIMIMGILASVAAQKWSKAVEQSRVDRTRRELEQLATAIVGDPELIANGLRTDFGYVGDVGALPPGLEALEVNPGGYATWNGPYVRPALSEYGRDYREDAWGVAYDYDGGVAITSRGSGSPLTRQFARNVSELTANSVAGTVTDAFGNPPGDSSETVHIFITYPDGQGAMSRAGQNPSPGGSFRFSGTIPVGNHEVTAACGADTLVRFVSVLPRSTAYVSFRFPGNPWGY